MTIDTDFLTKKKKQVSVQLPSLTSPVSTVRFCDLNFGRLQPSDDELDPHNRFEFGNFVARQALLHEEYWVPIIIHDESEQATTWTQVYSEKTTKQSIPVITAWQLNERMYGELQGLNKQETAERYGKEKVHEWCRSFDIPLPKGESLEVCFQRAVPYFKDFIEPQLKSGKHVMVASHGNSLRSIIMYRD